MLAQLAPENLEPIKIGLVVAFLVISLGIHEAAHGWTALQCGDTTARDLGRITLNPFAHIDLFMTILVPIGCYLLLGFPFGGAKPVPVDFRSLRHPWRDMALVALAGPASNLVLAALFFLLQKVLVLETGIWGPRTLGAQVLEMTIFFNLLLAAFNLLPLPPLDGSRVMAWILPASLRPAFMQLESFGLLLLVGALVFFRDQLTGVIFEGISLLAKGVEQVVTLGGIW